MAQRASFKFFLLDLFSQLCHSNQASYDKSTKSYCKISPYINAISLGNSFLRLMMAHTLVLCPVTEQSWLKLLWIRTWVISEIPSRSDKIRFLGVNPKFIFSLWVSMETPFIIRCWMSLTILLARAYEPIMMISLMMSKAFKFSRLISYTFILLFTMITD